MTSSPQRRWRRLAWVPVAALLGLSLWGWSRLRFESSLEALLPEDSEARATIRLLRDAEFADKVVIRLVATDPAIGEDELAATLERMAAKADPRHITRVVTPPAEGMVVADLLMLLEQVGELMDPDDLAALPELTTPAAVGRHLRQRQLELLRPGGDLFMARTVRHDPLGLGMRVLARAHRLSQALGFRVAIRHGHFFHADGREAMLLLETSVPMMDVAGSRDLVAGLERLSAEATPGIRVDLLCGHLHTVHNDRALRRDIQVAVLIATLAFLALFLALFRDWRAGIIFLIPVAAIAVAIGLSGWWFATLSTMVAGLAGAMAGIAVDYGIHVYLPVRRGTDRQAAVRQVARPVILGAFTTMGVFVAFLLSDVPAYRQLGAVATTSLILALAAALWLLPLVVRPAGTPATSTAPPGLTLRRWAAWLRWPATAIVILLLPATAWLARDVHFDTDLTALDGTPATILAAEQDFLAVWGRDASGMAIAISVGPSREAAAVAADHLYQEARKALPTGEPWSLSACWPAAATRLERARAWHRFWTPERIAELRTELSRQGADLGFADDAFAPFLDGLSRPPGQTPAAASRPDGLLASLEQRMAQHRAGNWWFLTYFPDTPENVTVMRQLVATLTPGGGVISRHAIGQALATAAAADGRRICLASMIFILLATMALARPWRLAPVVVLPALTAVAAMLALMAHTPLSLNVASVIAVIVVAGLGIDYGALVAHAWHRTPDNGLWSGTASVALSAATTLVGATSLLPAQHPALRHVGITLFVGVVVAYLTAIFVVPGLCLMLARPGANDDRRNDQPPSPAPQRPRRGWPRRSAGSLTAGIATTLAALSGCASIPFAEPELPPLSDANFATALEEFHAALPVRFTSDDSLIIRRRWRELAMLGYARVDRAAGTFELLCLSHMGIKLFHLAGNRETTRVIFAVPAFAEPPELLAAIADDLRHIHFNLIPPPTATPLVGRDTVRYRVADDAGGDVEYVFGGKDLHLLGKRHRCGWRTTWQVGFYEYGTAPDSLFPHGIVMENHRLGYRLIVKNREWQNVHDADTPAP